MIDQTQDPGRSINMLLAMYRTPQKGETDTARVYTKKDQRRYEYIRYSEYIARELNIKHRQEQIKYLIIKQDNLKDLCRSCSWETIITAIVYYIKCHYNPKCKTSHITRYKICKKNKLTLKKYTAIITNLKF